MPIPMSPAPPVEITPPAVGTPTTRPRFRVLTAWEKISALEKEFWLQSTTMGLLQGVGRWWWGQIGPWSPETAVALAFTLDVPADGHHSVAGESGAPGWVEVPERLPQADATCLQGFVVGEGIAAPAVEHPVDQGLVPPDQVIQAGGTTRLGMLELVGMEWGRMRQLRQRASRRILVHENLLSLWGDGAYHPRWVS